MLTVVAVVVAQDGKDDDNVSEDDADYDYVKEVLEEDQEYYNDYETAYDRYDDNEEEKIHQKQQQQQQQQQAEEEEMMRRREEEEQERLARKSAERLAREREAAFEAEMKQLTEDQAKAARKQKRRDARIVRRVLKAANSDNHYGVLGLWNWWIKIRIPARSVRFGRFFTLRIPEVSFCNISSRTIKRAYRNRALAVHPDKNRDGRAEEAFVAVENSASILSDPSQRSEYDNIIREQRQQRISELRHFTTDAVHGVLGVLHRIVTVFQTVLGPFAFPMTVILALLV